MTEVRLQVGKTHYVIETGILPPVGTKILVHKHLTGDSAYATVKVIGHEWSLEEAPAENENVFLLVRLATEIAP